MNFLIEYLLSIIQYFSYTNFTVRSKILDYTVEDPEKVDVGESKFWAVEREKWIREHSMYSVDVGSRDFSPVPKGITECQVRTRYYYNNKTFTFVSDEGSSSSWPPRRPPGMRFSLPIKNAVLLNDRGVPVKNITADVKYFTDNFGKFHNPFKYHTKIRITNALNQHSFINLCS